MKEFKKAEEWKGAFHNVLLGTLGTSLLGYNLAGKGTRNDSEDTKSKRQG